MRRLVIAAATVGIMAAGSASALATTAPPVPVGVSHDSNGGVCVGAFYWVPQCTDRLASSLS